MRLIGYARVSDKEQAETGYSIEAQQETIESWCLDQNHHLVSMYVEPGRSGSKPSQQTRPAFERAVAYILAGGAEGLVVKWMDRFARNVEDFLRIRSKFYQANKQLISISEPLLNGDPGDPIARYISTAIMNAYQLQAELSGLKAAQGRERRARQGHYPGSLPAGYIRQGREIKLDPELSPMILDAFFEFSTGKWSLDTWLKEAIRRGYHSRRGHKITKSGWHRIFRNRFYTGRYTWKGEEFEGDYPPLLEEEMFAAVQQLLDSSGPGRQTARHFWLLSGLLWSEPNHTTMVGAQIREFSYYRASGQRKPEHNVQAEELENRVICALANITWNGDGNLYRLPEPYHLAVKIASMGQIYPELSTKFEQREFLRLIFPKKGIVVATNGVITELRTFPGFAVQVL